MTKRRKFKWRYLFSSVPPRPHTPIYDAKTEWNSLHHLRWQFAVVVWMREQNLFYGHLCSLYAATLPNVPSHKAIKIKLCYFLWLYGKISCWLKDFPKWFIMRFYWMTSPLWLKEANVPVIFFLKKEIICGWKSASWKSKKWLLVFPWTLCMSKIFQKKNFLWHKSREIFKNLAWGEELFGKSWNFWFF